MPKHHGKSGSGASGRRKYDNRKSKNGAPSAWRSSAWRHEIFCRNLNHSNILIIYGYDSTENRGGLQYVG